MGRHGQSKSQLPYRREAIPELRASHRLIDAPELDVFFGELQRKLPDVIEEAKERGRGGREISRPQFRLYSDPEKSDITILERRLTRQHARKNRIRWNANDVGRITGEIDNAIGRLGLGGRQLSVEFTKVVRLGNPSSNQDGRKLGLLPEQESAEAGFFIEEHELAMDALTGNLRKFKYPYSTFIPHWTFGKVFKTVPEKQIGDAIKIINKQLPLTVDVEPIRFSACQEVDTGLIMPDLPDDDEFVDLVY